MSVAIQPWADTTSPGGKCILTVFAGMAEFARELIRERTRAGRDVAKRRGVPVRPPEEAECRAARSGGSPPGRRQVRQGGREYL